jgi:hypothetical protein
VIKQWYGLSSRNSVKTEGKEYGVCVDNYADKE